MIRRLITTARTILAWARDVALDLRDEARTIEADRYYVYEDEPAQSAELETRLRDTARDRDVWKEQFREEQRLHAATTVQVARWIRAAFADGYAAACTGGMSAADQRRLRERLARWLEVQRG